VSTRPVQGCTSRRGKRKSHCAPKASVISTGERPAWMPAPALMVGPASVSVTAYLLNGHWMRNRLPGHRTDTQPFLGRYLSAGGNLSNQLSQPLQVLLRDICYFEPRHVVPPPRTCNSDPFTNNVEAD
jgi:hypothetical protein